VRKIEIVTIFMNSDGWMPMPPAIPIHDFAPFTVFPKIAVKKRITDPAIKIYPDSLLPS
jgi:hypothetical protein